MTALFDDGSRGAQLSPDGRYRYDLWRRWDDGPLMGWVMLNPSTGDADVDDHTIRKCIGFAHLAGASGIRIVNLFAFRTPKPSELRAAARDGVDVIGPHADMMLELMAADTFGTRPIVAAWGAGPAGRWPLFGARAGTAAALFGHRLQVLRAPHVATAAPHPARLSYETPLAPYAQEHRAHHRT